MSPATKSALGRLVSAMSGRSRLNQPQEGCQLGRKQEGKIQSLQRASQVWLPWSQKKNGVIPLRSTVKGVGWRGPQSVLKRGNSSLVTAPSLRLNSCSRAGPLLHPVGVRGCRSPSRCPAPLWILPSSWDGKVSVALTRPLDLRSCSQNNPLASPASFKAGGVFQIGLVLQIQGVAGEVRMDSGELSVGSWGNWVALLPPG